MLAAEKKKKYTATDYMILEEGAPFQLINFELVLSPGPIPEHQIISGKIFNTMCLFLEQSGNDGIAIYSPLDVHFDDGNIFQPDLSAERRHIIQKMIEGTPEMIIEILSPSNACYDLRQKKEGYQRYGVQEYIIFNPIAKNADLYTLTDGAYILQQRAKNKEVLNSVLLPGLSFDLEKVFK
jgi:Uma2 family endonuclease